MLITATVDLAAALLLAGGLVARLERRLVLSVILALFGVATAHGPDLLAAIASR